MGMLRNLKNNVANAGALANQAGVMMQQQQAMQTAAVGPLDPSDPVWAPIEGITIDQYADISAGLATCGARGADEVAAYVQSQGVRPGTWLTVVNGFNQRMATSQVVMQRYGYRYSKQV